MFHKIVLKKHDILQRLQHVKSDLTVWPKPTDSIHETVDVDEGRMEEVWRPERAE